MESLPLTARRSLGAGSHCGPKRDAMARIPALEQGTPPTVVACFKIECRIQRRPLEVPFADGSGDSDSVALWKRSPFEGVL
ncbi:hypothetical protein [Salipiger abyssi]|uniref:hypothetical protein n=1 Tax=Salipiger abyssi TaxID=1250539 RepID=UPI0012EBF76E|nr:hypothetical protein [Salipiger abyssi]